MKHVSHFDKDNVRKKKFAGINAFISASILVFFSIGVSLVSCDGGSSAPTSNRHATIVAIVTKTVVGEWTENTQVSLLRTAAAYPAVTPTPGIVTEATATALAKDNFRATFSYSVSNDEGQGSACPGTYQALFWCAEFAFDGQLPQLGKVHIILALASGSTIVSSVRPSCLQEYEVGIMSATLDDTVSFTEQGTHCNKDKVDLNTYTITGGTGRFRSITGYGVVLSSAALAKHNMTIYTQQWSGTLQFS